MRLVELRAEIAPVPAEHRPRDRLDQCPLRLANQVGAQKVRAAGSVLPHPGRPVIEEGRQLRKALVTTTAELARLEVAAWQPEIPDLLLNIAHRPGLDLPPGTTPAAVETLERAALCLEIVELARADHGGALTAFEISARAGCLTDLDVAARRAMVAFCSANLKAS